MNGLFYEKIDYFTTRIEGIAADYCTNAKHAASLDKYTRLTRFSKTEQELRESIGKCCTIVAHDHDLHEVDEKMRKIWDKLDSFSLETEHLER